MKAFQVASLLPPFQASAWCLQRLKLSLLYLKEVTLLMKRRDQNICVSTLNWRELILGLRYLLSYLTLGWLTGGVDLSGGKTQIGKGKKKNITHSHSLETKGDISNASWVFGWFVLHILYLVDQLQNNLHLIWGVFKNSPCCLKIKAYLIQLYNCLYKLIELLLLYIQSILG